jgi:hypothetical protein
MRITKASYNERLAHRSAKDLYGYVRLGRHDCLIEYDGKISKGASALVVSAPVGMCFSPGGIAFARFDSLGALQVRLKEFSLLRVA